MFHLCFCMYFLASLAVQFLGATCAAPELLATHSCTRFRHGEHSVRVRRRQGHDLATEPEGIQPGVDGHAVCFYSRVAGRSHATSLCAFRRSADSQPAGRPSHRRTALRPFRTCRQAVTRPGWWRRHLCYGRPLRRRPTLSQTPAPPLPTRSVIFCVPNPYSVTQHWRRAPCDSGRRTACRRRAARRRPCSCVVITIALSV